MMDKITQTENGYQVTIGGQVMSVPNDPANEDYQRVQDALGNGMELTVPQGPTKAEALTAKRAAMVASPAQIRVTLWQLDLIGTVQAIADADPKAAIVWEYATEIRRTNDLIDALGSDGFTPEQIDDIFVYAMQVQI
jgi:hypothetical protein